MIGNVAALGTAAKTVLLRRVQALPKFSDWVYRPLELEVEMKCRPALFVPEQLDRVKRCAFSRSLESEVEKLSTTRWTSRPAAICELRDVLVLGGHVFHGEGRNLLKDSGVLKALFGTLRHIDHVAVPNSFLGLHYFGHWLRDDCSGYELARSFGPVASISGLSYRDLPAYARWFEQNWDEWGGFFAKSATFFSDIGFGSSKANRLRRLRARVRERIKPEGGAKVVLIRRELGDALREPRNEAELLTRLQQAGVRVVDGERAIEEVLPEIIDADVIIGMEGSQLAHAVMLLREGGAVIALQTPLRFYNPHHEWCRLLGMRYGTVIGSAVTDGFEIDGEEVIRMIDRVIGESRAERFA